MIFAAVAALLIFVVASSLLVGFRFLRGRPPAPDDRWTFAGRLLAGIFVPVLAMGVYLLIGRPDLASPPLDPGVVDVTSLEKALEKNPENIDGWRQLAAALGEESQHVEAARAWLRASELPGGDDAATLVHAAESLILAANGDVSDEAHNLVGRALAKNPEHVPGRFYKGLATLRKGKPEEAIQMWMSLLQDAPADAPYRSMIEVGIREAATEAGIVSPLLETQASPEDEQIRMMVDGLAARLAENPDDIKGWKRLGRSRRVLGENRAAYEAYEKALEINPGDPDALAGAAEARIFEAVESEGAPDEALALFRRLLEIQPDHALALFVLAEDEVLRGDPEVARSLFKRLLERLPEESQERETVLERLTILSNNGEDDAQSDSSSESQ